MKLFNCAKKVHSGSYIMLVCLSIMLLITCRSQKEVIKTAETDLLPEKAHTSFNEDKRPSLLSLQYADLCKENQNLIDSLKKGIVEYYGTTVINIHIDTVPIIFYTIFPQIIFSKTRCISRSSLSFSRGFGYFENHEYLLQDYFNILLAKMQYRQVPSFEDKVLAMISLVEDMNEDIKIERIKEINEPYKQTGIIYNYRVIAMVNGRNKEYLLVYNNQQFEEIMHKDNNGFVKGFCPRINEKL